MRKILDTYTSSLASRVRMATAQRPLKQSKGRDTEGIKLTLYDYEASPWCRIVREQMTFLGLNVLIKPCPRQTLFTEGAFNEHSRFRKEAFDQCKFNGHGTQFQFPVLVDETKVDDKKVITESREIVKHLWREYGTHITESRPKGDVILNSSRLPFFARFAFLSFPSVLRPFPRCGLLQTPSSIGPQQKPLKLLGAEGCPHARLIREVLSTLEIEYESIPTMYPGEYRLTDPNNNFDSDSWEEATNYLWKSYQKDRTPTWFARIPHPNLGRSGNFFSAAARAASAGKGSFVPDEIFCKKNVSN